MTFTAEEEALHIAAQCWCDPETSMIEMDARLAAAFAKRLVPYIAHVAELRELEALKGVKKA